jgi:hypothetical protein
MKVVLDFPMCGWFEFFGIKTRGYGLSTNARSFGHLIPTIPGLRNLQLRFQSWDDGYCYSPWGYRRSSTPSVPAVCCQRVMVDWIMTFAWPFIKEVSIVTIDGAVKEESKTRWDTLLALSKKDRVVAFNQPFAVRKILQTLHNLL